MQEIVRNGIKNCVFSMLSKFFLNCPNIKHNSKSQCAKLLIFCHMYNPILVSAA